MNQEMSDQAGKAIIAGVVVAALVAGYIFFKNSDSASQPLGTAPAGKIEQAMQQAGRQEQQTPRSGSPKGRPTGSATSSPTGSATSSPGSSSSR